MKTPRQYLQDERIHKLVHSLSSMQASVRVVSRLTKVPLGKLDEKTWRRIQTYIRDFEHDLGCNVFESRNALEHMGVKLGEGIGRPVFGTCNPMDLLNEILPGYVEMARRRSIEVETKDETKHKYKSTLPVVLEKDSVRQAFHNALANALKYSYKGAEDRYRFISIKCTRRLPISGGFSMQFQNYGIGIDTDELQLVWRAGYRGRRAISDGTLGNGFGLAQVRNCVKKHNGRSSLTSEPVSDDEGAPHRVTLTLEFPATTNVRRAYS